jgi:hypothetical protein
MLLCAVPMQKSKGIESRARRPRWAAGEARLSDLLTCPMVERLPFRCADFVHAPRAPLSLLSLLCVHSQNH